MILAITLGVVTAAAVTLGSLAVLLPWLRTLGVIDIPVERSLHSKPVVRGAGLALLPGMATGAIVTQILLDYSDGATVTFTSVLYLTLAGVVVLGFAGIGLSDDFFGHGVLSRLLLQAVIASLAAVAILLVGGTWLLWALPLAMGLLAGVNVTNFMDGANGLLALHGVVTAGWFGVIAATHELWGPLSAAVAAAGALVAFLPVNVRGRAFLGDVGSYALGAAWGVLGTTLLLAGVPVEAALAPAAVFLADFAYTLRLRVRAGDRWYQPHKLHVYQRLISAGWPHVASSSLAAGLTAVCALLTLPAVLGAGTVVRVLCLGLMLAALIGYLRLPVLLGAPAPWYDSRSSGWRGAEGRTA